MEVEERERERERERARERESEREGERERERVIRESRLLLLKKGHANKLILFVLKMKIFFSDDYCRPTNISCMVL